MARPELSGLEVQRRDEGRAQRRAADRPVVQLGPEGRSGDTVLIGQGCRGKRTDDRQIEHECAGRRSELDEAERAERRARLELRSPLTFVERSRVALSGGVLTKDGDGKQYEHGEQSRKTVHRGLRGDGGPSFLHSLRGTGRSKRHNGYGAAITCCARATPATTLPTAAPTCRIAAHRAPRSAANRTSTDSVSDTPSMPTIVPALNAAK